MILTILAGTTYAILFWRRLLIFGLVPLNLDVLRLFYPTFEIGQRLFHSGSLLWDPYRNFGQPFLAAPDSQVLYPVRWLGFFLSYLDYQRIVIVFHVALAAGAAGILFLRKSKSSMTAAVAALAFGFNGFFLNRSGYLVDFCSMAWAPLLLLLLLERKPKALGVTMALQWLAGFPPFSLLTVVLLTVFAAVEEKPADAFRCLVKGCSWAAGLSALQWLPFSEMLKESARALFSVPPGFASTSVSIVDLVVNLVVPSPLLWIEPGKTLNAFYVGPIFSFLFAIAILRHGRKERALGLVGLLFMLAATVQKLTSGVFRYPSHFLFPALTIFFFLATIGWTKIRNNSARKILLALMLADFLFYAWPTRFTWASSTVLTENHVTLVDGSKLANHNRLFATFAILKNDFGWRRRSPADWQFLKSVYPPSYATAFGIKEASSHHSLEGRRALEFQKRLNHQSQDRNLFDVAGIRMKIDISATGLAKAIPEPADVLVTENPNPKKHLFFVDSGADVRVIADEPGKLVAETEGPGRIVFSEAYYPGWRVRVDGSESRPGLYEDIFMWTDVSEGKHIIEFVYHPWSVRIGGIVSLMTLILFVASLWRSRQNEKSNTKP